MQWDPNEVSQQLWRDVELREGYQNELLRRVRRNEARAQPSKSMADRMSGEISALRQIASDRSLQSRESLLARVEDMLKDGDRTNPGINVDPELHKQGWTLLCNELLARFK